MELPPYSPTQHQLEEWLELINDVGDRWSDHIDEFWKDLPPEVCEVILVASLSFKDAVNTVERYLGIGDSEDEDDEEDAD